MPEPQASWSRRFMDRIPPVPDGLMILLGVALIFCGGMVTGSLWCTSHLSVFPSPSVQYQLDALATRVRALEQAKEPAHGPTP